MTSANWSNSIMRSLQGGHYTVGKVVYSHGNIGCAWRARLRLGGRRGRLDGQAERRVGLIVFVGGLGGHRGGYQPTSKLGQPPRRVRLAGVGLEVFGELPWPGGFVASNE